MKKTLFLMFAMAAAVSYAAPQGQDTAANKGDADLSGIKGTWYQYGTNAITTTANSVSLPQTWGGATGWVLFDNAITMTEKDTLTLSFTMDSPATDGVLALTLQGNNGKTAVTIGNTAYGSRNIATASATLATEGYHWSGNAQTIVFDAGNSTDRFQKVTPATDDIIGTTSTSGLGVVATISHNGEQFVMDMTADNTTVTLNLGNELSFDALVITGSANTAQAVNNISLSVVPEPATATLSLLALAGLAARRKRR